MKLIGDETKRLIPTEIGTIINRFVANSFKDIVDIDFTSSMEDALDDIAHGTQEYKSFLKGFYSKFHKDFKEIESKLIPKQKHSIGKEEEILKSSENIQYVKRITRYGPVI